MEGCFGNWADLPDLIIERIFSYLNIERRYYGSLVCKRWYQAFHLPYVWSTFVLADRYNLMLSHLLSEPSLFIFTLLYIGFFPEDDSTITLAGSTL